MTCEISLYIQEHFSHAVGFFCLVFEATRAHARLCWRRQRQDLPSPQKRWEHCQLGGGRWHHTVEMGSHIESFPAGRCCFRWLGKNADLCKSFEHTVYIKYCIYILYIDTHIVNIAGGSTLSRDVVCEFAFGSHSTSPCKAASAVPEKRIEKEVGTLSTRYTVILDIGEVGGVVCSSIA